MKAIPVPALELSAVAYAHHYNPHMILGAHSDGENTTIRVVRHLADSVEIVTKEKRYPATHEQDGVWVCVIPGVTIPAYRVEASYGEEISLSDDPYRHLPTLGELDQHLISEGRHEQLWKVLGAHPRSYQDDLGEVKGVAFAVWAPNAQAVRVVGDFNYWDGQAHCMRSLGSCGVWELFVPEAQVGQCYKYEICGPEGNWFQKADPMAQACEIPPATASVITESNYTWGDQEWLKKRAQNDPHKAPVSIYEVHLGSWEGETSYREMGTQLVEYVQKMGFTHVEFMPLAEHPFYGSWGYQDTGYYAPTSRYGSPDDFRFLVDQLHQAGIGVILDWVPGHFPKDDFALANFDGTKLYEDPDPLRGEQLDWGTLVFNYGRNEVRNFLVANALYWLDEFHIDGLRVDAVASMLYLDYSREEWRPNVYGGRENLEAISFMQEANATAYRLYPGIMMIAEESTAWPGVTAPTDSGGLGFGLKWNMGWMNDTLRYLNEDPVNRSWHHGELTFSLVYAFSENYVLPLSHDEVVYGKGSILAKQPGDHWRQLAGTRCLYAYQWSHPGKQLIFMGSEFGQGNEWNANQALDWWLLEDEGHQKLQNLVAELNRIYTSEPALHNDESSGFEWIDANDSDHNLISYIRKGVNIAGEVEQIVCIANFSGNPHEGYRVGLPEGGKWEEILNTDDSSWGGSGVGNLGAVTAEELPWNGRSYSAELRIPPLGCVWLKPA